MMKKYSFIVFAVLLSVFGCSKFDRSHTTEVNELASTGTEFIVSEVGGSVPIRIYTNGTVSAEILGGTPDWADIDKMKIDGDGEFIVFVNPNEGYRRMLTVRFALKDKNEVLDIAIKQNGNTQDISCESPYATASGVDDTEAYFYYNSDVADSLLSIEFNYPDIYKDWIGGYEMSNGKLTLKVDANRLDITRRVKIEVFFVDGWGEKKSAEMFLTQSDCNGKLGSEISFTRIKSYATQEGSAIDDDWLLEGIVVSDCHSPNMDLNPSLSSDAVDTLYSYRTAYLEGTDGSWGLRLQFNDEKENNLTFGMKVKVNLYGTIAYNETDPERYTVSGLSGWNMVSSESGTPVPVKNKKIADITDSDVYTYVSLMDTEFAFKKGSFADVLETNAAGSAATSVSALDGWASLLVDGDGEGIYAPVNMMCPWRRTGSGVPQGSGTTNGIIVHNDLKRLGDAGRYQIRVIDRSGFDMSESTNLQEYAYIINSYNNRNQYASIDSKYQYNKLATIIPSNDILVQAPARMEMICENTVVPASRQSDPYTTAKYYNATDKGKDNDGVSSAWVGIGDITTAHDWYKWTSDGEFNGYNGFVFTLNSTALSNAEYAEFAFDFAGGYTSVSTARSWPAHWCVEYSVDGGSNWSLVPNCVNGKDFVHMRGLPWSKAYYNGQWYQTPAQAGMGFSQHSFKLPEEALGQEVLQIRLRPYDKYIVSLPLDWEDDIEQSQIDFSTDVDIRVRFGFIYLRYRQ